MNVSTVDENSYMFSFEKTYVWDNYYGWLSENYLLPYWCCAVYLIVIFSIKRVMENRKPFSLRLPLIIWNAGLSVFSIIATVRFLPIFFDLLFNGGYYYSVCDATYLLPKVSGFWATWFVLMKMVELGDTVFIVLRKKPLLFLHWYHHITVTCYSFYSYVQVNSSGSWFIAMNTSVHSIMYTYFTLSAMGIKFPKFIPKVITSLQLLQMIFGVAVNISVLYYFLKGITCNTYLMNVFYSTLMYFSYAILFARFYRQAYLDNERRKKQPKMN